MTFSPFSPVVCMRPLWSLATKHELAKKNVAVQLLSPKTSLPITDLDAYLVTAKHAKIRRSSLLIPTEDAFVTGALHNIRRDGAPYWSHAIYPLPHAFIPRIYECVLGYLAVLVGGRQGSVVAGINKSMHEEYSTTGFDIRQGGGSRFMFGPIYMQHA